MIETEITKEHMDSLKALADTNVKIGIARSNLQKLEEEETAYLEARENKALGRIQKMFDDSKELLDGIRSNYVQVKELLNTASSFSDFLTKAYESLSALIKDFNQRGELWEAKVKEKEEEFALIKQDIKNDKVRIANDRQALDAKETLLRVEARKIQDERATLERAITRLKEGRI